MEVDRISRMGALDGQATPAWQTKGVRRRKFVEEVEPPLEDSAGEEQSDAQERPDSRDRGSFSASEDSPPESSADPAPGESSFRVTA